MRLELSAGGEVSGSLIGWDSVQLQVLGPQGVTAVPLVLVARAELEGEIVEGAALGALLGPAPAPQDRPAGPPPPVVGVASALWPGTGQALLRQRGPALGYLAVDAVLLGGAAWMLLHERNAVAALPFIGLDLVIRGYSAAEAVEEARRRRARGGL